MATSTMHISLPEPLKRFVKEQVEKEHYSTPSDFIQALIRAEQKRQAEKRLEEMVLEGLASGRGMTLDSPEWDTFWRRIDEKIASKK
ncbi:type II toxin-antitoxin system ParD family antitoxin [Methylocaldum sp. RMAD-M]|uniref:ribbon-helix-helix domain-containing protein n=1 Tax=Methylocaldum sp. RMAD-M TaxID=2806557 RepID=UPI001AE4FA05|nr:type II toxin-antitoxin system ParD family antitoxin [Methylocaldum sp. RMAD-M]MBP1152540.1 antitoxin ParD1/3/4 [Methylocaldum sp. RMAD-M]